MLPSLKEQPVPCACPSEQMGLWGVTSSDKSNQRGNVGDCWHFMHRLVYIPCGWNPPLMQGMNQGWLWRARWCWIWLWFKWDIHGIGAFLLFLYTRVNDSLLGTVHFGLTAPVLFWFPGVHCQINVRGRLQAGSCICVILYHGGAVWAHSEVVFHIKVSISHLWLL